MNIQITQNKIQHQVLESKPKSLKQEIILQPSIISETGVSPMLPILNILPLRWSCAQLLEWRIPLRPYANHRLFPLTHWRR